MTNRKPLRVSGLLATGKIKQKPDAQQITDFGTLGVDDVDQTPLQPGPTKLPLSLIDDSPYQPRIEYAPDEIENLGHSMAAAGLEEPIKVRPKRDGRFERITGHRRSRAAINIGWLEIDAYILPLSDQKAKLAVRVSNCGRVDLSDFELARMYRETLDDGAVSYQSEIAQLFGTKQSLVSMRLAMLKLPSVYITMLEALPSLFGVTCAATIAQLLKEFPDETTLIEMAVSRIKEGADQSSVKPWVLQMLKAKNKSTLQKDDAVVTDSLGHPLFRANLTDRDLSVQIKGAKIDAQQIKHVVVEALKKWADENIKV